LLARSAGYRRAAIRHTRWTGCTRSFRLRRRCARARCARGRDMSEQVGFLTEVPASGIDVFRVTELRPRQGMSFAQTFGLSLAQCEFPTRREAACSGQGATSSPSGRAAAIRAAGPAAACCAETKAAAPLLERLPGAPGDAAALAPAARFNAAGELFPDDAKRLEDRLLGFGHKEGHNSRGPRSSVDRAAVLEVARSGFLNRVSRCGCEILFRISFARLGTAATSRSSACRTRTSRANSSFRTS
jgi:hypothetical protein